MNKKITYLFIQKQPSQLDAPFYRCLDQEIPGEIIVLLFNSSGNKREDVDPELGFKPVFPDLDGGYSTKTIDEKSKGLFGLIKEIVTVNPLCVVVQDIKWSHKFFISFSCRLFKIKVGMRSDKNRISSNWRTGFWYWLECFLVKTMFNFLCPVSELTKEYYRWPDGKPCWYFPYCTDEKKFLRHDTYPSSISKSLRVRFGIPIQAFVFLAVVKFVDRENPKGIIDAFEKVVVSRPNTWLLMVGTGPQWETIKRSVEYRSMANICFAGYVPYVELHFYFFSSDAFIHLAKNEPWGVSAQDALVADMGIIISDKVGSGIRHLSYDLGRFVVPLKSVEITVKRMIELIDIDGMKNLFEPAKTRVMNGFTAQSLAREWANRSVRCQSGSGHH